MSLEEALRVQEEQVDNLLKAANKYVGTLKSWKKACQTGHIGNLQKAMAQAKETATGESAKFRDITKRMETLTQEGHRALVFSQFTDATFGIARLAHVLRAYRPLEFTGSLSPARRAEVVHRFMTDPTYKALLLSLRAGGVGLNLQAASYVFHLDRWWNPAIEDQADSRAHRMGQPYPVTIFRYISADTIEERIDATLKTKRKLFTDLVDDVSLDLTQTLNADELFRLFGLAR